MATSQRGGDVQKLLEANDKMLYTWKSLLESRPTLEKKEAYKEWHVKCVRYKEQIARSLERLAALADDQIAKKDSTTSTSTPATTVPVVPTTIATTTSAQQLIQKQQLQLQKQQQTQQQAVAAQIQQKKQQNTTGFPPGTDLAAMQLAMSQMLPMNMNQMLTGGGNTSYQNMNGTEMNNLFLMGDQMNQAQLNQMNLFNFNMQAAAYGNQMYNGTFNPALIQTMMSYPNQVLQAQMAAAVAAASNGSNGSGFQYPVNPTSSVNGTAATASSVSSSDTPAYFDNEQDTVKNVMDDFMTQNE